MKHRLVVLPSLGSNLVRQRWRAWAAALFAALTACGDGRATLVVLSDTTAATPPLVVVALPFDPAGLPAPAPAALPAGGRGDSVRLALARRDSALRADAAFHAARTAANDSARALASLDRRTAHYARRFTAWRALADSAESLLGRRDALTRRLERLVSRLGSDAAYLESTPPRRSRRAADSAAAAAGRPVGEAAITGGAASLELDPGTWWIAAGTADAVRLPAVRRIVAGGAAGRDTVWLGSKGRATRDAGGN